MTVENLAVPYHQQDTDTYCGVACANMVLAQMGAALASQDVLYTDARNHTAELGAWYNPPDGLQWVLNDRRPRMRSRASWCGRCITIRWLPSRWSSTATTGWWCAATTRPRRPLLPMT